MRRKKKHIRLLAVTGILAVSAVILFANRDRIVEQVRVRAVKEISKKLLTEQLGEELEVGEQRVDVSQMIENMEQKDVETLTDIAEKYISPENLREAADMAADGDLEGLKELAEEQISKEDQAQLQGLYEKYKNQIR
ncbi:MAG: hypothetical protein HFI74_03605 [Lachnospiraceae bacterium]|jgi:hypothetical protein|nr:hypothetical protein [Lachnospiraceae bacterium]